MRRACVHERPTQHILTAPPVALHAAYAEVMNLSEMDFTGEDGKKFVAPGLAGLFERSKVFYPRAK